MNTCWNSAFCRHAVFRLQISCGWGTPLRASRGTASHWDWGVLTAGTLLPPQPLSLLLLLRKAQLAAPCLIPVHFHLFPVPLLAATFQEGVRYQSSSSMRCVSGYYFAHCSQAGARAWRRRLGFGCSIPGRDVPEVGGSGCPPAPGLGSPRPSFPAFPMPGSFSHWMAASEQRNLSGSPCGRGDLPQERVFSLGYLALGRFALGLRTCGFSSLVFALFLPLMLHLLPCSVLGDHSQLPKTGCHITSSACYSSP